MDTESEQGAGTLGDVRLAIRRQHTQIAQLLDEVEGHAKGVIKGDDCAGYLNDAVVLLHRRFVRHLDFEQARLPPLLDAVPKERAAWLRAALADHADQRARVDGLLHDARVFADPKTLAREAIAFAHMMRVEMSDEDAALSSLG